MNEKKLPDNNSVVTGQRQYADFSVCMFVPNSVIVDSRVLKSAASLARRGFRVHLFGMNSKPELVHVSGYDFPITLVPNPSHQMRKKKTYLDDDGNMSCNSFVYELAWNLKTAIGDQVYDYLHTHDMFGLPVGGIIREKNTDIGKLGWIHDVHEYVEGSTHLPEFKRSASLRFEKRFIRRPHKLITVSPVLAEILKENYDVGTPSLVYNAPENYSVDPTPGEFCIRKQLKLDDEQFLMVYSGNVKPERGLDVAIQAMSRDSRLSLALLTDLRNPYLKEFEKNAERLGVNDRLHFHDYVSNNRVCEFIRSADIGIRTSTMYPNADLALDTKLLEYLHADLPIVTSRTTVASKFIDEVGGGWIYDCEDIDGFLSAVQEAMSSVSVPSRSTQTKYKYSWEKQASEIIKTYEKQVISNIESNQIEYSVPLFDRLLVQDWSEGLDRKLRSLNMVSDARGSFSSDYEFAIDKLVQSLILDKYNLEGIEFVCEIAAITRIKSHRTLLHLLEHIRDVWCQGIRSNVSDLSEQEYSAVLHMINTAINELSADNKSKAKRKSSYKDSDVLRIGILTTIWMRPELTEIVLSYYEWLQNQLKGEIDIVLVAVGSEGSESRALSEQNGFNYFEFPNLPLSSKWNYGLKQCSNYELDAVVIVGSDDLLDKQLFYRYDQFIRMGFPFIGLRDGYFFNTNLAELLHWKGYYYSNNLSERFGETVGMGRCYSRELLEHINYDLWGDSKIDKGLDNFATKRLEQQGCTPLFGCFHDLERDKRCFAQWSYTMDELDCVALDVKVGHSVTKYDNYKGNSKDHSVISGGISVLRNRFPYHTIQAICALEAAQIE